MKVDVFTADGWSLREPGEPAAKTAGSQNTYPYATVSSADFLDGIYADPPIREGRTQWRGGRSGGEAIEGRPAESERHMCRHVLAEEEGGKEDNQGRQQPWSWGTPLIGRRAIDDVNGQ